MKKNCFLRQCALALALLLAITIIFYSCKKDTHNAPEISGADLRAAKSWVKLNLKAIENNPFKTLSPNWDDVYTYTEDNQAIIEVGLTNPDKIFVGDSPNDYSQPELGLARSNIRLVLFKNVSNNSIVAGCYMVVVNNAGAAPVKLHYKRAGDLNGKVYYFNTDGSFSNGALYSNGQIIKANGKINSLNQSLLNKKLYSTAIKKLNIGIKDKIITVKSPCADGVEIPIWGQSCVGVEGYMTCTPYISGFAHLPGSCDGDYGDNGGYAGSHGGYAGGSNSSLNFAGNFVMDKITQDKYPGFTNLVKQLESFVTNDKKVLDALIKWSGYSREQILEKIKFGQGPIIVVKELTGKYGYFDRLENPNVINVDASWVRGLESANLLETKQATGFFLAVTVLHEFVHQARAANGLDRNYEYGYGFEQSAFGLIIENDGVAPYNYRFRLYKK